jgi:hypothetical protein
MDQPDPDPRADRINEAIFAGKKIDAIKLHREQTGMGLAESKQEVEKLEAQLRVSSPERFTQAQSAGCLSVIFIIAGFTIWRMLA